MVDLQSPGTGAKRPIQKPPTGASLHFDNVPVIWALDAFPDNFDLQLRTAGMLQRLYPLSPIYPVYVLSEESFADQGYTNSLRPTLKPMARKALASFLTSVRFLDLKKPRVLVERTASRSACARRLLRFAERVGAGLVAVSSHGRRGLSRLLIGSFSEALLLQDRLPVLMNGPKMDRVPYKPDVVVFPTDFSAACVHAYPEVLLLCRRWGAELRLFHKIVHPMDPIVQSGVHLLGGGWVSIEAYMNQPLDDHQAEADEWLRQAERFGIKGRYIRENFREPVSEAIVEYVDNLQQASPVLAITTQASPLASAILGSVTRDVIRLGTCPVYLVPRGDRCDEVELDVPSQA